MVYELKFIGTHKLYHIINNGAHSIGPQILERHFMAIALDSITLSIGELEPDQPLGSVQVVDVFLGCHSPLMCNQCFFQQEGPLACSLRQQIK